MKKFISLSAHLFILTSSVIFSQGTPFISELAPAHRTYYDIQSNGSSHLIQQDPNTPSNIHATFMYSPNGDSLVSSRRTVYCFSSDYGTTWYELGPVFPSMSSGFPVMLILSNGSALIGNQTKLGGTIERAQWFADVAPGAASFVQLDPGIYGSAAALWPVGIQTKMLNKHTKFVFVAGNMLNRGLSLEAPSFSGYIPQADISSSFRCAMAKSENGKIGLAYIMEGTITEGKVSFKESTDDGVTWSTPILIWDPLLNNNYGAFNGIDMSYNGNSPNIVFETVKYVSNQPDIRSTAKIQFWSPAVNSGNPIVLDSSNNMTAPNPQSDGYAAVCRPVIGIGDNLIVAYCKARTDVLDSNNYFDIYYRLSSNSGNTWMNPEMITNNSGPLNDNRYVSVSNKNSTRAFHLVFQQDSIPGSFINGAGKSLAKTMHCKIVLPYPPFGIQNIGTEIPAAYKLNQNFPNPFNPKTNIDFDIPKESVVKLTVYNSQGEVVARLVNQQLSAGSYRVDWNAEIFSSGIYFYTISAGKYYEAKKMVLIR
ncbi:MAG TPA: T9SS type A sorting domain-containing protein [Ignavibacteria bacterium]|nr:T9SS type A sorting domain-containing protein [Ignavibacteria bacterium]